MQTRQGSTEQVHFGKAPQKYLLSGWPHIWLPPLGFWLCCHGPEVGLEVNQARVYACQQANDLLKNGKWWAIMKPKKIRGWIRLREQSGDWGAYKCQDWTQLLQIVSVTNELFKCGYQSTTRSWQSRNWQACACVRTHARTHTLVSTENLLDVAGFIGIYMPIVPTLRMQKPADLLCLRPVKLRDSLSRRNPHNKNPGNIFGAPT